MLTWDPRGFGDSGGNVEVDSPDYEAKDASALIDLGSPSSRRPQLDGPGDPQLGMFGASYGGGIEWVTAATDKRVDVIAPSISWNSLITSLDKNDTAKGGWGSVLFGTGAQGSTVRPHRGASGQRPASSSARTQDPATQQAFADGVATGSFDQEDKDFFAARGPNFLLDKVRVPTLITQGTSDTLFTLQEAIDNYAAMKRNGVPLKMVWFCGSLSNASSGGDIVHGAVQLRTRARQEASSSTGRCAG